MNSLSRPLVALLLGVWLGASLVACGKDKSSEEHLLTGRYLMSRGAYTEAVNEFKAALNDDIHLVEARALLGSAYYQLGEYDGADKELSRALQSGQAVDRSMVVPILAQTLLHIGEYDRLDNLEIEGLEPESRSVTLAAKGLAILFRGDEVVAADILRAATSTEKVSLYARVAMARLHMAEQDYETARAQLEALLQEDGQYLPAWNLLGDIDAARRRPAQAEQAYSKVLKLNPRAFDARLNRAMMRIYRQNFKGAREDINTLERLHGRVARSHAGVSFARGITLMQAGQRAQARKEFEKTADTSYAYPLSYYYMAVIDLLDGTLQRALTEVYRFLALAPESIAGPKLAARLELQLGGYHSAAALLEPIVEAYPRDVEALNLLASATLAQGRGGEGVELLARVAELMPDSASAKTRLGAAYLAAGRVDAGIAVLEDTLQIHPDFEQADILLILNYLRDERVAMAVQAARAYLERNPGSSAAYNLLGRALLADGQLTQAHEAFHQALEINIADPAPRHGLAEIALQQGRFEDARRQYRQVLKHHEDRLSTQLDLAASYALEGREQPMLDRLNLAMETHPEAVEPRLVLARFYIGKGQLESAEHLFDGLSTAQREQPDVLATLAGFQLAAGRYNQALVTLEKLIDVRPGVGQYHYMRAKAYAALGDQELFLPELQRTVELDPDHFYARLAQARLALVSGQEKLFQERLTDLKETAPHNPDVVQLEVAAAQRAGEDRQAAYLLGILLQQTPTTANLIALANHWIGVGKHSQALKRLNEWLVDNPRDVEARQKLAETYRDMGDLDSAIAEYRRVVQLDPDNVVGLNNLAWYLRETSPGDALVFAEKAYSLAPDSSSVLDTLAIVQLRNEQPVEARRTLERALEITPDSPDLRFHEARILLAEGRREGAVEALTAVLASHDEFEARKEAEELLRQLR